MISTPRTWPPRLFTRWITPLLSALVVTVGLAPASAVAAPVFVRFDGDFMGQAWGIGASSIADATAAMVPTVSVGPLGQALNAPVPMGMDPGPFSITQNLMSYTDPTASTVEALSNWTATNVSMADLSGTHFLVWSRVVDTFPSGDPYTGNQVQIEIDPALGWVLAETIVMGTSIVYPALMIDGLAADAAFSFDINYLIDRALPTGSANVPGGIAHYLPQFQLNKATPASVIPEPATATLFGLGLLGLVAKRRRGL